MSRAERFEHRTRASALGAAQDGGCFSGKQMPLGKAPLSASDISLTTSWINAGTP
ncbi:MAG TPA: hypothetical protein VGF76_27010 [Polyangiaceae bacterium]